MHLQNWSREELGGFYEVPRARKRGAWLDGWQKKSESRNLKAPPTLQKPSEASTCRLPQTGVGLPALCKLARGLGSRKGVGEQNLRAQGFSILISHRDSVDHPRYPLLKILGRALY